MKKLAAVIAVTAALATPALAQSTYNPVTGEYIQSSRTHIMVPYANQPLGPIYTERGVMTDPDPNVRLDLHRNYDHYVHGTGG
jgi:hypothetical protein